MFFNTLSGRFLGLTIIFVLIAEVLIFVPSVARFRLDYVQNRLDLAQLAALALLATPGEAVSPELEQELLQTAGVLNVVLRRQDVRELVLASPMPEQVAETYDIRDPSSMALIGDALAVFGRGEDRIVRFIGRTARGAPSDIEVTLHEAPLRRAMVDYGLRILYLSLAISVATATLLFFAVQRLIVRPINRVVDHMTAYRDAPEDATRIIEPRRGAEELQRAEAALRDLEVALTAALKQKDRLAALGGAVAKISHDLRNLLTTAQLLADRLETSPDPTVARIAPKLVGSIARAISLCERTLTYGKAEEPPPEMSVFPLAELIAEVAENEARAAPQELVAVRAEVDPGLKVRADPEQLFRVLSNLVRNAAQAIAASGSPGSVTVLADADGRGCEILVRDTGPGLAPKARENLFRPFQGGARRGGAGLGLVIAAELVRGQGGTLTLDATGPEGTTFRISLPGACGG
jgi:signal transduction histidine kinase